MYMHIVVHWKHYRMLTEVLKLMYSSLI